MATTAEYLTQLQTDKATLVTNLVAKGVDATNDETFTTLVPKVADISTGGGTEPIFTGHYDTEGLKQIGWTDEEINYYNQNGVQWNSSEDEYFKLTQTELAGDDSKNTRFLPKNSTKTSFANYYKLLAIPQLDTSNVSNMNRMFYNCYSLKTIPQLNTSKVTNISSMFSYCYSLTTIPQLDTSNVSNMSSMFYSCNSLTAIPQLDTSKVIDMSSMFSGCYSLKTIPQLNTSKVTTTAKMFYNCQNLSNIPQLDTSKVTNMSYTFYGCSSLSNLGGFQNLGQAYSTTQSANYSYYKLDLSTCTALTEQSLINVLTNLYDIATKGVAQQQCVLGSTNLAKLTSEEGQSALASSTEKGWTLS